MVSPAIGITGSREDERCGILAGRALQQSGDPGGRQALVPSQRCVDDQVHDRQLLAQISVRAVPAGGQLVLLGGRLCVFQSIGTVSSCEHLAATCGRRWSNHG